jgi:hypothetical protein
LHEGHKGKNNQEDFADHEEHDAAKVDRREAVVPNRSESQSAGDPMKQASPVLVDFGNRDQDGALRLVTRGTVEHLKFHGITLSEGLEITMSDGELTAEGTCTHRQGIWVAGVSGGKT